jgi:hypothetical protein
VPDVVIEVTSKKTKREDINKKRVIYQDILKVKEYFLYDPLYEYLKPGLQGYRLEDGIYQVIEKRGNRLRSLELGLDFAEEDGILNLYDTLTGFKILTSEELLQNAEEKALMVEEKVLMAKEKALLEAEARKKAEEKALLEAQKSNHLLEELEQLKAELSALKKQVI